jgi:hypothetical protein
VISGKQVRQVEAGSPRTGKQVGTPATSKKLSTRITGPSRTILNVTHSFPSNIKIKKVLFLTQSYNFALWLLKHDKELKKFPIILLLAIVFLQTFSSFVIEANYLINKGYISRILCINKEKPKMHCNGKCYLAKQLKEQEQQEQQASNSKKEKFEVQPFFLPKGFAFVAIAVAPKVEYFHTVVIIRSPLLRCIFHPPTV